MTTIRNWIREHRRTTAFLREHKDEYYPKAKEPAILYFLSAAMLGFMVLVGVEISLTYESAFQTFWFGTMFGISFLALSYGAITLLIRAKKIQVHLKKKYNYSPNR